MGIQARAEPSGLLRGDRPDRHIRDTDINDALRARK